MLLADMDAAFGRGRLGATLGEWIELAPMVRGVQQLVLVLCALAEPIAAACAPLRETVRP